MSRVLPINNNIYRRVLFGSFNRFGYAVVISCNLQVTTYNLKQRYEILVT